MKNSYWIILSLIIIISIMIGFRKPIKKALTRGYQNKNPGNIRLTSDVWKGEIKGTDKSFKTFKTMGWGYRAIFILLKSYRAEQWDTIRKIISHYAPSSENDTLAYIKLVSSKAGISPDDKINFNDENLLKRIVSGISYQENGIIANPSEIDEGLNLFKNA